MPTSAVFIVSDDIPRGDGNGASVRTEVAESVVDQFAYPVLTEEVTFPTPAPTSSGGGGGGVGSGTLARTVDAALRDVLGGRTRTANPKDFTSRLTQAFNLTYVGGHVEASWVPPNSVQVQVDLGAITGAQASIYSRAKVALDQSVPLLDGLASLRTDILPEDQEATRTIVRAEFSQLVTELGMEGGPRVQRVDELFNYLLGTPIPAPVTVPPYPNADDLVANQQSVRDPASGAPRFFSGATPWPDNHLGELGLRFGMQRGRVNTIDDEQDLTNFIILADYMFGLWQTWVNQRPYFSRLNPPGVQPFFGTQMVLLSRALAVVSESVQEVNFTMDSVFLGPAERQTLQLNFVSPPPFNLQNPGGGTTAYSFPAGTSPLYVAELLDWIDRVATDEGPRLIQDAGKDGTVALTRTLDNLRTFARGALIIHASGWGGVQHAHAVPRGYATPRVQRAVRELADALYQALVLASQIQGLQIPNE